MSPKLPKHWRTPSLLDTPSAKLRLETTSWHWQVKTLLSSSVQSHGRMPLPPFSNEISPEALVAMQRFRSRLDTTETGVSSAAELSAQLAVIRSVLAV
jgi:hypothetical protein